VQQSSPNESTYQSFKSLPLRLYPETNEALPLPYGVDGIAQADERAVTGTDSLSTTDSYFSHGMKARQHHSHDAVSNILRTTFSRASNLIREGMEVEGAVFFGASVVLSQYRNTSDNNLRELNSALSESGSSRDDEDCAEVRPGPPSHAIHSAYPPLADAHHLGGVVHTTDEPARPESNILGFSTLKHSSLNGHNKEDTDAFLVIDQNLLTSLVKHYPAGKLFVFDYQGPISYQRKTAVSPKIFTVSMKHKRDRHKARKRAEVISLLAAFPKANHIFFVPLYDSISKCFIGSFTWSTSATRVFSTENDLSYLIAFGHSVMTEVSRLNSLSGDRAKDQFINNVSHELRSPLHGILASAEFLADTSMDGFQRSLVDNVDSCGRTLLDTIEHILDFSKIKKFGQNTKQSMGVVAEVDISTVIEEVVEGVYAGFEIHGLSSQGSSDMLKSWTRDASDMKNDMLGSETLKIASNSDIRSIILDIDFREQWRFPTVPGTWRRLAMNLFDNALKFTPAGWIKVKLEARNVSPVDLIQNDGKERTMVILTISDSGRGISEDFLETKLFMPFSQVLILVLKPSIFVVTYANDVEGGRHHARDGSRYEYCEATCRPSRRQDRSP
jgi:signal transduction histidine kinase